MVMNMSGVGTRQTGSFSQPFEIMNQHNNFYGYLRRNVNRKTQNAASLLSFQLQSEVIVLAISSEQWPGERGEMFYVSPTSRLRHDMG
jgi:hypothetical protein